MWVLETCIKSIREPGCAITIKWMPCWCIFSFIKVIVTLTLTSAWHSLGYQEAHSGLCSRGQVRK